MTRSKADRTTGEERFRQFLGHPTIGRTEMIRLLHCSESHLDRRTGDGTLPQPNFDNGVQSWKVSDVKAAWNVNPDIMFMNFSHRKRRVSEQTRAKLRLASKAYRERIRTQTTASNMTPILEEIARLIPTDILLKVIGYRAS